MSYDIQLLDPVTREVILLDEAHAMTGAESIPVLERAASALGDDVSDNYWDATEGNAKRPLLKLAALAKMHPDGVWDGD